VAGAGVGVGEAEPRGGFGDVAAAPGDGLSRGIHAQVAPARTEPASERHGKPPPATANVQHGIVRAQASRVLDRRAQQQARGQEVRCIGRPDAVQGGAIRQGEARGGEKCLRLGSREKEGGPLQDRSPSEYIAMQ